MKIKSIDILNYRNIGNCNIIFNDDVNYIIGENNIGKSNLLVLLDTICNGRAFEESDFENSESPIEIVLEIKLLPEELGFFGDNFSPEDSSIIKLRYTQKIDEAYPTIVGSETGEALQARQIKKIHFLKYDSTVVPSKELRVDTQKGTGLLINSIIESYIRNDESGKGFLESNQIESLKDYINEHLSKIRSFKDYSIKAVVSDKIDEILSKLFFLSDGKRKIEDTGKGVQFIATATINIICQIMNIYKNKTVVFEEHLYTNPEEKKMLPIVLSVDEPEVHLHPFLQRSLIRYYQRILQNKDSDFLDLLKMCFDIDGLDGQLIIVTHSTDALIGNYRNLIRFYQKEGKTSVVSGKNLALRDTNEKHLLMRFPEFKEAFYAKCVILIEGETEYGCIQSFAETLGVSLDDNGICVINACGESSIKPLKCLLNAFVIHSVAIYDGDVKCGHTPNNDEFFTNELCFEIEVVKHLCSIGKQSIVKEIVRDLNLNAENEVLDIDFIRKPFKKLGLDTTAYIPKKLSDISEGNLEKFCNVYSSWYMVKKGVLLGRIIGQTLTAEQIPSCYANAIRKAQEVAQNA